MYAARDGWISLAREGGSAVPALSRMLTELPQTEAEPIKGCIRLLWARPECQGWLRLFFGVRMGMVAPSAWAPNVYTSIMAAIMAQVRAFEHAEVAIARGGDR